MTSMSFILFEQMSSDNVRTQELLKEFKAVAEKHHSNLGHIVNHRGIRLSIHSPIDLDNFTNLYLVFIIGRNDTVLMELGKSHGMPRGFPIIWHRKKMLSIYGFYPKFDNDDINDATTPPELDAMSSQEFVINLKYSGFLCQVLPFVYITAVNKNGTDSNFHRCFDCIRITQDFANALYRRQIGIYGELLSCHDQVHGNRINNDAWIITLMSHFSTVVLDDVAETHGHNTVFPQFVTPLASDDVRSLCLENNLCIGDVYTTTDRTIVRNIHAHRNIMTTKLLRSIMASNITVLPGNIDHDLICGPVVEGLIIKITNLAGITFFIKMKFAHYVVRTMLLRDIFRVRNADESLAMYVSYLRSLSTDPSIIVARYVTEINRFIKRWVLADSHGSEFWSRVIIHVFNNLDNIVYRYITIFVATEPPMNFHIYLGEIIFDLKDTDISSLNATIPMKRHFQSNLIIVTGTVGVGKSTFANAMCLTADQCVHVDGDVLGLKPNVAVNLSIERPDFTVWTIIWNLLQNRTVVFTTGASLLTSSRFDRMFEEIATVFAIYEHVLNVTTIALSENISSREIFNTALHGSLLSIPVSNEALKITVAHRTQGMTNKNNINSLENALRASVQNTAKSIVHGLVLMQRHGQVLVAPGINRTTGMFDAQHFEIPSLEVSQSQSDSIRYFVSQHRILCSYQNADSSVNYGHITLQYEPNACHMSTVNPVGQYPIALAATIVECHPFTTNHQSNTIVKFVTFTHDLILRHITMSHGPHRAVDINIFARHHAMNTKQFVVQGRLYQVALEIPTTVILIQEFSVVSP
jgi:hypothetical protein